MFNQRSVFGILLCGVAVMLASCSSVQEVEVKQPPNARQQQALVTISPRPPALSDPAVTTTRSASEYYHDLERCRASTAATMGAAGADDQVSALKRALENGSEGSTVTAAYLPTDRAVIRDRSVKACLSKKGYVIN